MVMLAKIKDFPAAALLVDGQLVHAVHPRFPNEGDVATLESIGETLAAALDCALEVTELPHAIAEKDYDWRIIVITYLGVYNTDYALELCSEPERGISLIYNDAPEFSGLRWKWVSTSTGQSSKHSFDSERMAALDAIRTLYPTQQQT